MKRAVPTVRLGSVAYCAMQKAVYNQERLNWRETNARLSSHPRYLHMLWNEYAFGVGINKATKLFNPGKHGKVKHKYCLRKVFLDTVDEMIL